MAFKSKYKGAEIEEKLDKIEGIPSLISEMLTSRDYVTNSDLICILKNYAPSDYSTIPIDNVTIYWDRGILKSRGSGTGNGLWELRENSLGERFLYSTLPVVTKFGITTYSDEDASDIMSDLWLNIPIDNDTIYWYTNEDGTMVLKSKGGNGGNSSELLELLSKLFKGHFDNDGKLLFIEAMADIAVNGGMTLYYDNGAGDLPTIYDGLPIDGTTITWKTIVENGESKNVIVANINEDQLQDYLDKYGYVKGDINGNIDLSDYATLKYVKENYVSNNYLSEELKKYVTLSGNQDITGIKNFINGLQIGGLSIYKSKENVIYIDSDVVIKGGLTTYSDDSEDSSSILDALPIASTSSAGIAYFDSEFFTIDNTGKVSLKYTDSGGLDENQLKIYLTNNKYVTQDWVLKQDYASSNSVKLIQEELNIFLKGADTDDIINKWKELEVFLSGLSETDNLATILSNKADKEDVLDFIPNSGYTEITGEKNFVGGLKVNNGSISYNEEGYWTLEGSLLVTGGITMYGAENGSISANIMDAILTDGTTIRVNPETKQLEVIGGGTSIPINIYDGLDSPSTSTALSANQGRVLKELIDNIELGDIDLSGYLPTTGGTLNGGLKINGGLELSMTTPYIDFHYNGSTSDFTSRIIEASSGELTFNCKGVFGGLLKAANGLQMWHPASNKYCDVWHSGIFEPANYLPLSGGTVEGALFVGGTSIGTGHLSTISSKARLSLISFTDGHNYIESGNSDFSANTPLRITGKNAGLGSDLYLFFNNIYCRGNNYINIDSGNYSSYALPLTGGIIKGSSDTPLQIKSPLFGFVGLNLFTDETLALHLGYWDKLGGVRFENLRNQSKSGIGVLDNGLVVQYSYDDSYNFTKNKIWHAGNFNPSNYLPLTGGTISSTEILPITISNNINDGEFQVGIRLLNPNKTNTNGNTIGTAQFGYTKSDGVYMFNYDNYNYYNCAIGITDDGIAYVGKGGSLDTKYKIWHEGNHGSGSGLDADLLDGYNEETFYRPRGRLNGTDVNVLLNNGSYWTAEFTPVTGAYNYGSFLNFNNGGRCTQFYITDGQQKAGTGGRIFFRDSWNAQTSITSRWLEIITNENIGSQTVSKANQLTTARTIWGQSFDGTKDITGDFKAIGSMTMETGTGFDTSKVLALMNTADDHGRIGLHIYGQAQSNNDSIGADGRSAIKFFRKYNKPTSWSYSYSIQHHIPNDLLLLNNSSGAVVSINQSGNVGIGTNSPSFKLDVKGGVSAQSYGGYNGNANVSSSYRWAIYQWNNELQITRRDSSNTHKGTMVGFDLASGNVVFEAGITMYSDQRKKTILNHVELSLKQIADAPLIEHYYNSDESKTTHVGSIAQYWAEMNDWFCKKDNEGFYTMEIQNAALASAISIARELVKFESETNRRIRILERENKELKREVKKLKKLWQ